MDVVVIWITREVAQQWINDGGRFFRLTRQQGEELRIAENVSLPPNFLYRDIFHEPLQVLIGHHPNNATSSQIGRGQFIRYLQLGV